MHSDKQVQDPKYCFQIAIVVNVFNTVKMEFVSVTIYSMFFFNIWFKSNLMYIETITYSM